MFTDINIKPFAGFIQKIRAAAFLFGNFCGGFQKEAKRDAIYKWVKFLCRSAEDAIPLLWVQGRSALLGSRGKAHWRVKGGSPYRVKGETPCPARVDACVNSYWVLSDAKTGRFGSKAAFSAERNLKRRRTE